MRILFLIFSSFFICFALTLPMGLNTTYSHITSCFSGHNNTQFIMPRLNNSQPKCEASPLYIIFEQYYKGHPYKNVNLGRDHSHWNVKGLQIHTNPLFDYKLKKKIGAGAFGTVFKATHLPTDKVYAFKQLATLEDHELKKEIQVMRELADAPNMLPIRDIVKGRDSKGKLKAGLVVDFFPTENYKTLFKKLNQFQIKTFIYQVLETLSVAHSRGIVHRDIKPLNVLMNPETNEAKLIDWGASDFFLPHVRYNSDVSTIYFKSPEVLLEYGHHDYALDIWSTGCMLAEMIFKKDHLFRAEHYSPYPKSSDTFRVFTMKKLQNHKEQLDSIARLLGTLKLKQFADKFQDKISLKLIDGIPDYPKVPFSSLVNDANRHLYDTKVEDLLEKMLTYDHTRRITAAEALLHPYFDEVRQVHSQKSVKSGDQFIQEQMRSVRSAAMSLHAVTY